MNAWILAWDQRQIVRDPLNLFQANIFHPFRDTLAYSETILAPALLAAPARLFTSNAIAIQNVSMLTAFLALALSCYLFFHWLTGDPVAAAAGAVIVSLSPVRFAQLGQVQLLHTAAFPLLVYSLWSFLESRRARFGALFAAAVLFELLSSFYLGLMALLASAIVALGAVVRLGPRHALKSCWLLSPWVAAIVLVAVPFVLPYHRLAETFGHTRPLELETLNWASHKDYLKPMWESFGSRIFGFDWSLPRGRSLYLGSIVVALALFAFLRSRDQGRRERMAVFVLGSLGAVFMMLSFGGWRTIRGQRLRLPFYWLHELPGFEGIRATSRFAIVVDLAVVGLAVIGLAVLSRIVTARHGRASAAVLAAGIGAFGLLERAPRLPFAPGESVEVGAEVPHVYRWLASDSADARVLELPMAVGPGEREPWDVVPYRMVYFSTIHWKPIVNGVSAYVPPGYPELTQRMWSFPAASAIDTLLDLPINRVVVHRNLYASPIPTSLFDERFRVRHDCAEDLVLELDGRAIDRPSLKPTLSILSRSASAAWLALEWSGDAPEFLYPPVRLALTVGAVDPDGAERKTELVRWVTDPRSRRTFRIEAGGRARSLSIEAQTDSGESASATVELADEAARMNSRRQPPSPTS